MRKTLIRNEQEYRNHVYKIYTTCNGGGDLWEGCDKDKLKLAFELLDVLQSKNHDEFIRLMNDPKYHAAFDYHNSLDQFEWHRKHVDFVMDLRDAGSYIGHVAEAVGIETSYTCYDYDDDGNEVDGNEVDEDGNIIPDDLASPDTLVLADWVKELSYPLMFLESIQSGWDRTGDTFMCVVEVVELKEFELS